MALDKATVTAESEQKIIELADTAAKHISIVKTKLEIKTASELSRLLRVINNPNSVLTYNEVQLLLQACVNIGDLNL